MIQQDFSVPANPSAIQLYSVSVNKLGVALILIALQCRVVYQIVNCVLFASKILQTLTTLAIKRRQDSIPKSCFLSFPSFPNFRFPTLVRLSIVVAGRIM